MLESTSTIKPAQALAALCALSDAPGDVTVESVRQLIISAPDPATALQEILSPLGNCSLALQNKWHEVVFSLWSEHHPHLPSLLDLPFTTSDVSHVPAYQDYLAALHSIASQPPALVFENREWLLEPTDAYRLMLNIPSFAENPPLIENEWQHLPLRRLRATLEALRLVRRHAGRCVIIKSRYQRFHKLPAIHQYYLLWHAEAYHVDWSQFSSFWGDHFKVIQEYMSILWSLSEGALPDIPRDIRGWNQDIWDAYLPIWENVGLLHQPIGHQGLLALIRLHSLPTALTQVVIKDLFARYGLLYTNGQRYAYTKLGADLLAAERTEDLPCALDLLK